MRRSLSHQQNIRQFFDQLAATYAQRYSQQEPYLQYWFDERLRLAWETRTTLGKVSWTLVRATALYIRHCMKKPPPLLTTRLMYLRRCWLKALYPLHNAR